MKLERNKKLPKIMYHNETVDEAKIRESLLEKMEQEDEEFENQISKD